MSDFSNIQTLGVAEAFTGAAGISSPAPETAASPIVLLEEPETKDPAQKGILDSLEHNQGLLRILHKMMSLSPKCICVDSESDS
jgi:hypothetical protein